MIGFLMAIMRATPELDAFSFSVEYWSSSSEQAPPVVNSHFGNDQLAPILEATIFHCPASKNSNPNA